MNEHLSEPAAPTAPARWTRHLATAAIIGIVLVLVVGIGARLMGRSLPFHLVFGCFLACFAGLKFSVATDAVLRLRDRRGDEIDPCVTYGSRAMAIGWTVYKYTAAVVALGAAIYVFTVGAARVDRLFAG